MPSKPKCKTYIVHRNGNFRQRRVIGRYRVGARNEKEAVELLRKKIGKHIKARVYYEDKFDLVEYGYVEEDIPNNGLK